MSPGNSIEIAIWVAVGGRGTLVGAVVRRISGRDRLKPRNPDEVEEAADRKSEDTAAAET